MPRKRNHLEILQAGRAEWNGWRQEKPDVVPTLNFSDLSGLDLSGYDLRGADFTQSVIRDTSFSGAHLEDADLSFSKLEGLDFSGAYLTEASLGSCEVKDTSFQRSLCASAILDKSRFERVDFQRAMGIYASFADTAFKGAKFARATLTQADFGRAELPRANLRGASLSGADFGLASLERAILREAYLEDASFDRADLTGAKLQKAQLINTNLRGANLAGANLEEANLSHADLHGAQLQGANLAKSLIHGVAAWNVSLDESSVQSELVISGDGEPLLTVDDIEVAQFVYLMAHNPKIRNLLGTITSKAVLILGRFTPERKEILDALRSALRARNYVPIVFDFEKVTSRDFTETIMILAGLCLFIIADITQPKSSPLELQATVPYYKTPFVPIIGQGEKPFSMFADLRNKYPWVLDPLEYRSATMLIKALDRGIIQRAMAKQAELLQEKAQQMITLSAEDFSG